MVTISFRNVLDDHFVIAISDANFSRYNITAEDLKMAMNRHPKVKTALICIGEGAEALWYDFSIFPKSMGYQHK